MKKSRQTFAFLLSLAALLVTGTLPLQAQDDGKDWLIVNNEEAGQLGMTIQQALSEKLGRTALQADFKAIEYMKVSGVVGSANGSYDYSVFYYTMGSDCELKEVDFSGVTEVGDFYFQGPKKVTRVVQPATAVKAIACRDLPLLTEMSLPASIEELPNYFLEYCTSIESISLPSGITKIGYNSFRGCTSLESIVIPNSVTELGQSSFEGCTSLASVTLSNKLTLIDQYMFYRCTSLKQISIPASVTRLGQKVFYESGLTSLVVPNTVRIIDGNFVERCHSLVSLKFPDELDEFNGDYHCYYCENLETVVLPKNLTRLSRSFLHECYKITENSFTLPETVETIGGYAFCNCPALTHFTIPSHVKTINSNAFQNSGLTSVVWPEQITTIPGACFAECSQLASITLPETVKAIEYSAFEATAITSLKLPKGLKELPSNMCYKCYSLTSVTMPEELVTIGNCAFESCTSLTHVDLPGTVETIGRSAFYDCPLTELPFPPKVTAYEGRQFHGHKAKNVVVPEGVKRIADRVFYSEVMESIDLPTTLQYISDYPLGYGNPVLKSVTMRTVLPPEGRLQRVVYWDNADAKLYVPQAGLARYKAYTDFTDGSILEENILPIPGGYDPGRLIVANTDTIKPEDTFTATKRDLLLTFNTATNWYNVGSLLVAPGATLNMGTATLTWRNSNTWYQTRSCSLINRGTMTADRISTILQHDNGASEWQFITPPTDMTVADISAEYANAPFVIRTYDSQARAVGNSAATWRNLAPGETLKAGQGYIFRFDPVLTKDMYGEWKKIGSEQLFYFNPPAGANTYLLRNDDVTLPLTDYKGEFEHNRGWNFIGNPFLAYFDIYYLDTDAPLLLREGSGYKAYSPVDDELVLDPLRAFFVQRTDQFTALTFTEQGRQQNKTISHEAAARQNSRTALRRAALRQQRTVYDLTLTAAASPTGNDASSTSGNGDAVPDASPSGETVAPSGTTRLVINPQATARYDRGKDAPYMQPELWGDAPITAPQLYTVAAGVRYAINERPAEEADVALAYTAATAGTLTISLTSRRSDAEALYLLDRETGITHELSEPYTFETEAGTYENRLVLRLGNGVTQVASPSLTSGSNQLYDLQGRRVSAAARGLLISNGKKVIR